MTDGLTEGPAEDDETTVFVVAPQVPDGRPKVLLLGSGELAGELALALQRLGAEAITMTEGDGLSAAIQRHRPDLVATTAGAVWIEALDTLVAGSDNPELVPNARAVRLTTDREGLRRLAADELGLPTAPFWAAGSVSELRAVAAHAGYPLLVKPVVGAAGQGRSIVAGPDDIESAWQRAVGTAAPERQRVLAETVVEIEFDATLLAVRSEGAHGPVIEFCAPIGHHRTTDGVLESWQPQQMSAAALDAAKSIAARIVKALGGRGVFGVELMVNGDEVYFAGVTAGPQHSAWVTLCTQRLSVFDLQARAILGLPVDTMMISPGAARAIPQGRDGLPGAAALGNALGVPESNLRVFGGLGVVLATAPDVAVACERAREAATALNMRDSRA